MPKYNYEITIESPSEKEAERKVSALTELGKKVSGKAISVLSKKLTGKELERLAHILENDPNTTALAKKYLGL